MLAAIIGLLFSYFFPNIGPWLILSAVMTLQLYICGECSLSKSIIFLLSIGVALAGATLAMFSATLWILWAMVISIISLTFYVGYQGSDRASMGLWSAILLLINIFFPIYGEEWVERFSLLLIGVLIAYFMLFIKAPKRRKDKVIPRIDDFLSVFQSYIDNVFNALLFERHYDQNNQQHDKVKEAITQLQNLTGTLHLTYNINSPAVKNLLVVSANSYNSIFHWLVAIERLQKINLSLDLKLCIENLHTTLQSFFHSFFEETSDHQKTSNTSNYWLRKMLDISEEAHVTASYFMNLSELFYLLQELIHELETLAVFLDSRSAKEGIAYLQKTGA